MIENLLKRLKVIDKNGNRIAPRRQLDWALSLLDLYPIPYHNPENDLEYERQYIGEVLNFAIRERNV